MTIEKRESGERAFPVSTQVVLSAGLWPQQVISEQYGKDQVPDAEQKQHLERKARPEEAEQANGKRPILEHRSIDEQRAILPVIPPDRNIRGSEQHGRAANKHSKQFWTEVAEVNQWSDEPLKE